MKLTYDKAFDQCATDITEIENRITQLENTDTRITNILETQSKILEEHEAQITRNTDSNNKTCVLMYILLLWLAIISISCFINVSRTSDFEKRITRVETTITKDVEP